MVSSFFKIVIYIRPAARSAQGQRPATVLVVGISLYAMSLRNRFRKCTPVCLFYSGTRRCSAIDRETGKRRMDSALCLRNRKRGRLDGFSLYWTSIYTEGYLLKIAQFEGRGRGERWESWLQANRLTVIARQMRALTRIASCPPMWPARKPISRLPSGISP